MSAKTTNETGDTTPGSPAIQVHLSRRMVGVLMAVVLLPWLVAGGLFVGSRAMRRSVMKSAEPLPLSGARVVQSHPGPWGDLELVRIAVEPPEEFIFVNEAQEPPNWFFRGYSSESVVGLLNGTQLTAAQRALLADQARWQITAEGVWMRPSADVVLGLAPEARERIYNILALYPENRPQNTAFSFNPEFLAERLELSGLTEATIEHFKSLLYRRGDLLLFADMSIVLPRLPDNHERVRFVKTLSRKTTLLAKLKINQDSDVERLVEYWGFDGRSKDLRPLIESLKRVPGGSKLDVAHLLPGFARRRLYTYPVPSNDPLAGRRDCHWSSLNFFSEQPDDRFADQQVAISTIGGNYYQIASGARLGDLVLLTTRDERVVHSAVYVADEIVFTKNGPMFTQPWMLQRLGDLVEYYSAFYPPNEPLRVRFYRQKELAPVQGAGAP